MSSILSDTYVVDYWAFLNLFILSKKIISVILSLVLVLAPAEFALAMGSDNDMDMSDISMSDLVVTTVTNMDMQHMSGHEAHGMNQDVDQQHQHEGSCDEPCSNCAACGAALMTSAASGGSTHFSFVYFLPIGFVQAELEHDLDPPRYL